MITSTHYRSLPDSLAVDLPIRLHEMPSNRAILRRISLAGTIAIVLIAPPAIIYAMFMLGEANFSSISNAIYRFAAVTVAAIALASVFSKMLLSLVIRKFGRRRVITINKTQVTVRQQTLFGSQEWSEPLSGYDGVERHVRETVDGLQHKLVLSHPKPNRQIPVWIGAPVPDALVTGYQSILSRSANAGSS